MRTLTLGVLIVTVGTLAALPFRRYQAIPDASSVPSQVTGPTRSALDTSQDPDDANTKVADASTANGEDSDVPRTDELLVALPEWSQPTEPKPQRRIDIPLTYEDLAMPIDQPTIVAEKFNATAKVRQQQLEEQQVAALVMPRMESLAVSQREELRKATESTEAAATLASSTMRETTVQQLPDAEQVERDRHWIRQPE